MGNTLLVGNKHAAKVKDRSTLHPPCSILLEPCISLPTLQQGTSNPSRTTRCGRVGSTGASLFPNNLVYGVLLHYLSLPACRWQQAGGAPSLPAQPPPI